jgi:tRNA modification GTPase
VAAIASFGLYGPRAWEVVRALFRPHRVLPADPEPGQTAFGWLGEGAAEQVVITVRGLHPQPSIEVHCHGGREVVRLLYETFQARGLLPCSWQRFQSHLEPDTLRSAAAVALASAPTVRTAAILLDQYHGALKRAVQEILAALERNEGQEAARLLQALTAASAIGRHLTTPWRVVVAGAPNVGKSSLVNALAGYPRCVVAPTPGTTRDLVTTLLAVDGWPLELIDTAGLREGQEMLERAGIDLARGAITGADLCLWILDASAPPQWPDFQTESIRFVINKVDLPAEWEIDQLPDAVRMSALKGAGLEELCRMLAASLVPRPPMPGAAVPFAVAITERIRDARDALLCGRAAASRQELQALLRDDEG